MNSNDTFTFGIICLVRASHRRVSISHRTAQNFSLLPSIGICHIESNRSAALPLYETWWACDWQKVDNLFKSKPPASAPPDHTDSISVLICVEFTSASSRKIQWHTAKPIRLLIQISSSQFLLRNDFNICHNIHFYFTLAHISLVFCWCPPSLFLRNRIQIHSFLCRIIRHFRNRYRKVEAMQIPHVATMFYPFFFSLLIFIWFEKSKWINTTDAAATVCSVRQHYDGKWHCGGDLALHFNQYLSFQLKRWHLWRT